MALETLSLRAARPDDFRAVDQLLSQSYPRLLKHDYPPSVMVTAVPIISRAKPSLLRSGTYFLAESQEGEILGAGGWTPHRVRQGVAEIRHVVTDHRHQRVGIGRALLEQVIKSTRRAGIQRLDCLATRTAEGFYQSLGFTSMGPIDIELRPGIHFPAIHMHLHL